MNKLWLFLLPALFLPNIGLAQKTPFGILQISDFLIGFYLLAVYFAIQKDNFQTELFINQLSQLFIVFLYWTICATTLTLLLSGGLSEHVLIFSMLKFGKLSLYITAGVLTVKALVRDNMFEYYNWSLLASGLFMGISMLIGRYFFVEQSFVTDQVKDPFYLDNLISVQMAILISYLLGLLLSEYGTKKWRWTAKVVLIIMAMGAALSSGRGGWVALLAATLYLFYNLRLKRTFGIGLVLIVLVTIAYNSFPTFQTNIDKTINPNIEYMNRYQTDFYGIESGARWRYWLKEGVKLLDAPILGHGFFNRGSLTGLDPDGSHNFFIQMFLETGIVGGVLILLIFFKMWLQASSNAATIAGSKLQVRAVILAAFISGLSGEYFYGGMVSFLLILSYGAVGRLPSSRMPSINKNIHRTPSINKNIQMIIVFYKRKFNDNSNRT